MASSKKILAIPAFHSLEPFFTGSFESLMTISSRKSFPPPPFFRWPWRRKKRAWLPADEMFGGLEGLGDFFVVVTDLRVAAYVPEIYTNNWTTLPKTSVSAPEQKNDEQWEDPGSFWVFQGLFSGWKTVFFWGCKWWFQVFSIFAPGEDKPSFGQKPPRSNADSNLWRTHSNFSSVA